MNKEREKQKERKRATHVTGLLRSRHAWAGMERRFCEVFDGVNDSSLREYLGLACKPPTVMLKG